jgi:hypothetical protein
MSSVNLHRSLMPIKLHAKLMTLAGKVRRVAAREEQDRGRRQAMAEAALAWPIACRVFCQVVRKRAGISTITSHGWFACNASTAERPASRSAPRLMHPPRMPPELDRFLLPVNRTGAATRAPWFTAFVSGYRAEQISQKPQGGRRRSRAVPTGRNQRKMVGTLSPCPSSKKSGA